MRQYSISISQEQWQYKTLITKKQFYILRIEFTIGYKTSQKIFLEALSPDPQEAYPSAFRLGPVGLSLRKSPIKNHATLFKLGRIVNQIKHN